MFKLTNARGETVDINTPSLRSYTPTGLGLQITNSYSPYETYFIPTKSVLSQGIMQVYMKFGDIESQSYQSFSDFAQFLAYQPYTLEYDFDDNNYYRDARLQSLTKTEIGGSTIDAYDRLNEIFTLEFINNWYNNKTAEYKSYDPDPNLGTYGKIYRLKYDPYVGGRNYILNSSGTNATDVVRPTLIGNVSSVNDDTSVSYTSESIVIKSKKPSTMYGWYYALASNQVVPTNNPIISGQNYTLSAKVRGTASQAALRWGSTIGVSNNGTKFYNISNTWTKISATFAISAGARDIFLRIQGAVNNQYLTGFTGNETLEFKEVKLERGNIPTDWTPAPEDNLAIPFGYAYGVSQSNGPYTDFALADVAQLEK